MSWRGLLKLKRVSRKLIVARKGATEINRHAKRPVEMAKGAKLSWKRRRLTAQAAKLAWQRQLSNVAASGNEIQ